MAMAETPAQLPTVPAADGLGKAAEDDMTEVICEFCQVAPVPDSKICTPDIDGSQESVLVSESVPQGERRMSEMSVMSVQDALTEVHGDRICRAKDLLFIPLFIAFFGLIFWVLNSQSERLVAFSTFFRDFGFFGRVLYFVLFIFVGLPCGYNWSMLVTLVGFSYGWAGLIDTHIGTITSYLFTFAWSRQFCKACAERWVQAMSMKKRQYFLACKYVIEKERAGFLMLVLLRMNPLTTFGSENCFLGSFCDVSLARFAFSSYLGCLRNIILLTNSGVLIRKMGSVDALASSSEGLRDFIINVVIWLLFFVVLFFFCRYLIVRVLPRLISQGLVIDVPT